MSLRFHFGRFVLDTATRELRRDQVPVALQARVFECLQYLIEHRDRAVTRDELVRAVFRRTDVSDAQLGQVIVRTRRAVGDDGQAQHTVLTVPRYGFRWVAATVADAGGGPADDDASGRTAPRDADGQPRQRDLPAAGEDLAATPAAPAAGAITCDSGLPSGAEGDPPPATPARRTGLPRAFAVVAALLVAVALAWGLRDEAPTAVPDPGAASWGRTPEGEPSEPGALLVLPTRVDAGDGMAWVRLGLMDYIGDRLRRGGLAVLSSESALAAHARGAVDDDAQLRAMIGRGWRVDSTVARQGTVWSVRLVARDGDGVAHASSADAADVLDAARLAVDRLAPRLGGRAPDGTEVPGLGERLQRARAAMLANELDAARAILMEAPELQRAQPRLQYQLARVDFRAGEHAQGLERLDRLLAGEGPLEPLFRAQVLNARGAMLLRLERLEDAEATYDEALRLADGHPAELGQALSGRAVVHAMDGRFDRALSDFAQARVALRSAGDALAVARIDANLGILESDRGRPAHALPPLEAAESAFSGMGAVNELATVLGARVQAELRLLRVDEALATSARGIALLERVADPVQRGELVRARAAALRMAGEPAPAAALLVDGGDPGPGLSARLDAGLLEVRLALDRDLPDQALALADATLAEVPAGVQPEHRAWLQLLREQAAWRLDRPARPGPEAGLGAFVPDRLRHALALARAERPTPEVEAAFADALSLAERQGVPFGIAEVVTAYAGWLLAHGRTADAAVVAGRVAPWSAGVPALADLQAKVDAANAK